jgi:hypothetical protein
MKYSRPTLRHSATIIPNISGPAFRPLVAGRGAEEVGAGSLAKSNAGNAARTGAGAGARGTLAQLAAGQRYQVGMIIIGVLDKKPQLVVGFRVIEVRSRIGHEKDLG